MNTEYAIHVAIVDHLKGQIRKGNKTYPCEKPFKGLFVTHIYGGRSKDEGFFLKQLGVTAGVADLFFMHKEIWGFVEIKTESGRPSEAQRRFRDMCAMMGVKWALVRSVREAHDQFVAWGLKADHSLVSEPDLRSFQQKNKDVFDMYKR